jgi:hypothetical protein
MADDFAVLGLLSDVAISTSKTLRDIGGACRKELIG